MQNRINIVQLHNERASERDIRSTVVQLQGACHVVQTCRIQSERHAFLDRLMHSHRLISCHDKFGDGTCPRRCAIQSAATPHACVKTSSPRTCFRRQRIFLASQSWTPHVARMSECRELSNECRNSKSVKNQNVRYIPVSV